MIRVLLVSATLLAGCSTLERTADSVNRSPYFPANWRIAPDAPPLEPPKREAATLDGIPTLVEKPGSRLWVAHKGSTARAMMEEWAKTAGYTLKWQAAVDRKIEVGASVYGPFQETVEQVFNEGFPGPPALTPRFNHGNRVVRITQDGTLGE
ncbi:TcpQ domain-containing protein [Elstera sp.]|uniref:TcpQ domain-containing protein n=1 Tax=Elstera sp. TaxID=1916664 RepID=UPI0037BF3DEF